jgi:hypothetical protein
MTEKRLIFEGDNGVANRVILCDENGDPYTASGGSGGGSANDREFVTTTYIATDSGTGYSAGDTITATRVYDVDGASITIVGSTIWFNETTGLALAGAPTSGHLSTVAANAATETTLAQLKTVAENIDGGVDTANEALTGINGHVDGLETSVGATNASAAAADGTGNYSVIAALKRSLLNWASALTALGSSAWRVSGFAAIPSASFNRPADTTAYASGDLIANSTTAGSVTPLSISVARVAAGSFLINRVRLSKNGTGVTGASFRVHLFNVAPTVANGDNAALLTSGRAGYIGRVDFDMTAATIFNDGNAATADAGFLVALASGQTVWALIEARGAYAPASGETFALTLEVAQN